MSTRKGISPETGSPETGVGRSNNALKTGGHRFGPGNKYGKGRPEGSRNKATIALLVMLEAGGSAVTKKVLEMAKAGDIAAVRLVLERLIPPARERRISIKFPRVESAADVTAALAAVLDAVAGGELGPAEAQSVASLLEATRRSIEVSDLELRITILERKRDAEQQAG